MAGHGEPRHQFHRDHPGGAAQGLCLRHFPHGRERRGPGALLDRAGTARRHPARRFPRTGAARAHRPRDALHGARQPRFRRRHRRLRRAQAPGAPAPGSMPASAASTARSMRRGHCHTVEVYDGASWSAASTASRSAAPSSARACSIARATPPRSRWCIWSRGSSPAATRLLDTQFVTDHLRSFGALEVPQAAISPAAGGGAHRRGRFRRAADADGRCAAPRRWRSSAAASGRSAIER